MDINRGAHQDLRYPIARFNEKGCLLVWGADALMLYLFILELNAPTAASSHEF
jgi:hypothetical protein